MVLMVFNVSFIVFGVYQLVSSALDLDKRNGLSAQLFYALTNFEIWKRLLYILNVFA